MKVMNILHDSVVDGPGLRTVIFFAGCPHRCKGCHNPQSWNMKNGTDLTVEDIMVEVCSNPLANVTFSGGDPFVQAKKIVPLAKKIKKLGKNIWIYTGYTMEELQSSKDVYKHQLLSLCDVLVDGPFILELRDLSLPYRGSSNQRIIELQQPIHD